MSHSTTLCSLDRICAAGVPLEAPLESSVPSARIFDDPPEMLLKPASIGGCRTAGDGCADRDCDDVHKVVTTRTFKSGD